MKMKKNSVKKEYISRINKVIDYIENNIDSQLSLNSLAKIANFSPYHFHRIFAYTVGETLNKFIQRIRIEKAAWILRDNPDSTIADITYTYGFSSPSVFARVFKDRFNMSATEWRELNDFEISKICKQDSKLNKQLSNIEKYFKNGNTYFADVFDVQFYINKWSIKMIDSELKTEVNVQEFPEMKVAYVRHIGPYAGDGKLFEGLINKLMKWAVTRGLLNEKTQLMSVYHDNPDITDESKLRLSMCINIPDNTSVDGDIGMMMLEGGAYAVGRFELGEKDYENAWKMMYAGWLPESGYQPEDKPAFEIYRNDPRNHPEGKSIVDICVPVKPL